VLPHGKGFVVLRPEVVVLNWLAEVWSRMDPRTTARTRD
jgi:hypothetical protein